MTSYNKTAAQRALRECFIASPEIRDSLDSLTELQDSPLEGTTALCACIFGPSGSGKTALARKYATMRLDKIQRSGPPSAAKPRPIVEITMPSPASEKALLQKLLHALDDPAPERGTSVHLDRRAANLLRQRGVGLLIIDEIQHLLLRNRRIDQSAMRAADSIKALLNHQICPIILMGTEDAEMILDYNDQLKRRTSDIIRLTPLPFTTKTQKQVFATILTRFQEQLEDHLPFETSLANVSEPIHAATDGLMGNIVSLLDSAIRLACRRSRPFDREILAEAYEAKRPPGHSHFNPFATRREVVG